MTAPGSRGRMAGFTFLETVVGLAILSIVGSLSFQAIQVTSNASSRTTFQSELDLRVHRTLERVVRELQEAQGASVTPDPVEPFGAAKLDYRCAEVGDANTIVWGLPRRLELVASATDPLDGMDNDHDGLVDEHELHLIYDAGQDTQRSVVLVRNVAALLQGESANAEDDNANGLIDEPGFTISRRGDALYVRLSLQGRDGQGRLVTRTSETTVCPRN